LLYHFPGKKELIIALMDSYVSHLSAELESATEPFKGHPQALVLGFIHWYKKFNGIAATNRTWGAAVFAVQSFDPQLMEPLHNWYRQLFEKIRNSGPASLDTATAIMAIEGLFMLSLYNLDQLTTEEKSRIIQHIEDRLLMRELNPKNSIE
ncbi:TetR/AcrR family transcriptional regulator, partial [Bacteroides ovatus]